MMLSASSLIFFDLEFKFVKIDVELIKITLYIDESLHEFKIVFAAPNPIEAIFINI